MRRQIIIAAKSFFLILLISSTVFGQTDSWETAFDSVPEQFRSQLLGRFRLMAEYERTQQWDALYDLLEKRRLPSKDSYVEQRRNAYTNSQQMRVVEFVPTNVDKEGADMTKADYRITGYMKVRERGCIVKRNGTVYAFLQNGEWYFSGYLITLTPSHSPPPPCLDENNQ